MRIDAVERLHLDSSGRPCPTGTTRVLFVIAAMVAVCGLPSVIAADDDEIPASPGPLSAAHATLDNPGACISCHEPDQSFTPGKCLACHKPIAERVTARKGVHREITDECAMCHEEHAGRDAELIVFDTEDFDHLGETGFPLNGMHSEAATDCTICHEQTSFLTLDPTCSSCHDDPHAGSFGDGCADCHNVGAPFSETGRTFDHARTGFVLNTRHATLPCEVCHGGRDGAGLSFDMSDACTTCHLDAHNGELGTTCQDCHGGDSFQVSEHVHRGDPGFFLGDHASASCEDCHVNMADPPGDDPARRVLFSTVNSADCSSCHEDAHAGTLGTSCTDCHDLSGGSFRNASRAFHKDALMPLEGRHLAVPCAECHWNGQIEATPTTCYDCHWIRRQDDRYRTALGADCEQCHRPTSWTAVNWDHASATGVPLAGAHATLDCDSCHTSGHFDGGTPSDCVSCHLGDYQDADDPNHIAAGFPTDCQICHNPSDGSWDRVGFNHATFPLVGTHATLDCAECHSSGVYQGLPSDCVDCHLTDYQGTDDPNHIAAGFPTDCELCHSPSSPTWDGATVDHTGFQLVGTHATLDCAECHSSGIYQGLPAECVDCHGDDFQQSANPNHLAAGFDTECETCHRPSDPAWTDGQYPHSIFPLVATHEAQPCNACHSTNVFNGLPSECVDCHITDYQNTTDPAHATAGFPTDCVLCHLTTSPTWDGATFNHSTFPLAGAHTALDCAECHSSGVYQGLPSDCVDCHFTDYQETDDPDHAVAGFPTDCVLCHSSTSPTWDGAIIDHTSFQLEGTHATLDCAECHGGGVYQGLPAECVDCHSDDHQHAVNPNHLAAGFDTECETCHQGSDPSWQDGRYPHSIYPLVATHEAQPCNACHVSNVFVGLPSECVDCHLADYQGTTDPDHVTAGFPTDCILCHAVTSPTWLGASFDHSSFQLVGAHTTLECNDCHSSGVYQGLPSDCVDCHLTNYQSTTDPNHVAAGFPTDCVLCHAATSTTWTGASFDHSSFQLLGTHATLECAECHSSGVYQGLPSDCVDCHLSDYQQTNDPDHIAAGFPTDCEICHRGSDLSWDQGTFDHVWFPINSGAHRNFECSDCHPSGGNFSIFNCTGACHPRSETDPDHDEVPGYVYNSSACYSCHPNGEADFGRSRMMRSHGSR